MELRRPGLGRGIMRRLKKRRKAIGKYKKAGLWQGDGKRYKPENVCFNSKV